MGGGNVNRRLRAGGGDGGVTFRGWPHPTCRCRRMDRYADHFGFWRRRDFRGVRIREGLSGSAALKISSPVQRADKLNPEQTTGEKTAAEGPRRHNPASEDERSDAARGTAAERPSRCGAPRSTTASGEADGSYEAGNREALSGRAQRWFGIVAGFRMYADGNLSGALANARNLRAMAAERQAVRYRRMRRGCGPAARDRDWLVRAAAAHGGPRTVVTFSVG